VCDKLQCGMQCAEQCHRSDCNIKVGETRIKLSLSDGAQNELIYQAALYHSVYNSPRTRRRGNGLSLLAKSALASPVEDTSSAPVSCKIVFAF
jgi:hypothetical protein